MAKPRPAGVNGFLVLLRRYFDDEPLRLFATRKEAVAFAKQVELGPGDTGPKLERGCIGTAEAGTLGVPSQAVGISVIEFSDGIPDKWEPVIAFIGKREAKARGIEAEGEVGDAEG